MRGQNALFNIATTQYLGHLMIFEGEGGADTGCPKKKRLDLEM